MSVYPYGKEWLQDRLSPVFTIMIFFLWGCGDSHVEKNPLRFMDFTLS